MVQYVKVKQESLLTVDDPKKSQDLAHQSISGTECLIFVSPDDPYNIQKRMFAEVINTTQRLQAYETYQDNIDGSVFGGRPESQLALSCDFDIDNPPN